MYFTNFIRAQDNSQLLQTLQADSSKSFFKRFMLTGNAWGNYEKTIGASGYEWYGELSPVILANISKRFFFESEIRFSNDIRKLDVEIGYATLHYKINKFFTIGAGKFITPYGIFTERLHPAWINKFANAPLGFDHHERMVGPMDEIGIEIRGGAPLGSSKINYAAYISNAPVLTSNPSDASMPGMLESGGMNFRNKHLAFGGRIGFLPFSNSSFEIGVSRQQAKIGSLKDSLLKNARTIMHSFDLSYVKSIPAIKSIIDFKSQFNYVLIDRKNGDATMDSLRSPTMNTNSSTPNYDINRAYFIQLAVRPALSKNKILSKMEVAGRFCSMYILNQEMESTGGLRHSGSTDVSNTNQTQWAASLNYWFSWRTVLKFSYVVTKEKGTKDDAVFLIQLAVAHPVPFHKRSKPAK